MNIRMGIDREDLKKFLKDLEIISLPDKKKREILIRSLQMIKRQAVKSAANQRNPMGGSWKKRKNGTAKMLRRIAKLANSKAEKAQGALFYKQKRTGEIAQEHQEGIPHLFKKTEFTGKNKGGIGSDPCTLRQAKKLKDLGYTVANGKTKNGKAKRRKPTLSEIRSTLSRAKASLIIRKLEEKNGINPSRHLTQWMIPTEKRPFLDTRDEENAKIILAEIQKYTQKQQ